MQMIKGSKVVSLYEKIRDEVNSLKKQDIHFPFHYRYPKFLLRNAKFSAATVVGDTSGAYFLEGKLTGLTNQPVVYGKPTRFDLGLENI